VRAWLVSLSAILVLVGEVALDAGTTAQGRAIHPGAGAAVQHRHRVLILYTDRVDLPANIVLDRGIRSTLIAGAD
jgi:hypothetical protein